MKGIKRTCFAVLAAVCLLWRPAVAQITDEIEADIPFPFTVENTQLPPGTYTFRVLAGSDLNAMEVVSADEKTHVEFLVGSADLPTLAPKTELEFHRYGTREFLSKIFEEGTNAGAELYPSRAELRLIKQKVKRTIHRHPAHKKQAGM